MQAESVSDTALNGAQVTSLLDVLARVQQGLLTPDGAVQVIVAAFPTISVARARAMVAGGADATGPAVDESTGGPAPEGGAAEPDAPLAQRRKRSEQADYTDTTSQTSRRSPSPIANALSGASGDRET